MTPEAFCPSKGPDWASSSTKQNWNASVKIDADEFRARQRSFAAALSSAGYDGAIVVSRGGSTLDRYANVFYLTGHYQHYGYLPESPPIFSGRAHSCLVMDADGRNVLCVAVPEVDEANVFADRIAYSDRWVATVAGAIAELGLAQGTLGLVGDDVLPTNQWKMLKQQAPHVVWSDAEPLLNALRRIKSPAEQALIRESCRINREAVTAFFAAARPGATEADCVADALDVVARHGSGLYYAAVSSGPHADRWMTSPLPGWSTRELEAGDLLRLDLASVFEGYLSDFGRTIVVGGRPSADQQRLLDVLHLALDGAIGAAQPGAMVRDVVAAGEQVLESEGVARDGGARPGEICASYPAHWGHCLGLGWERPWMVADSEAAIEPGMYLAIERALTLEGVGTVAAEQNLLVGDHGADVLTVGPDGTWS
jgi:Xaa-Pro aminopeptidase